MDAVDRASRRRTAELNLKPETGLAEWTSKIKALQRQVDQDEEEETRRLEQEIAASRLARLRRSTGGASRNSSVDLSKSDIAASLKDLDSNTSGSEAKTPGDRLRNQDDALRKLSGDTQKQTSIYSEPGAMEKRDTPKAPISLAAFIGGRATGPRLTKHAPQQDAHDPTQFEQRTQVNAPHPVFGRGGVAMPGMTRPGNGAPSSASGNGLATNTNLASERDRRSSTPPVVKAFVQRVEENRSVVAHPTGASSYPSRQRTISTPTGGFPQRSPRSDSFESSITTRSPPIQSSLAGLAPSPELSLRSTTPQGRRTPAPSEPSRSASRSPLPRTSPAPIHSPPSPSMSMSTAPKSPVSTTSLSRPIQPQARMSSAVQLSPSQVASAAFLKPPPPKDPTPSISRLQGRGFVQSMVRASSQLEASSGAPGSPSQSSGRPESARKSTVLDRWQHDKPGSSSPPIISPKPVSMRKSHTTDDSSPSGSGTHAVSPPRIVKPDYTGRSLKPAASTPSMSHAYMSSKTQGDISSETPSRLQGLGSGNTMISYIKPIKTGDQPVTASAAPSRPASSQSRPPSRPPSAAAHSRKGSPEPDVDELGVRRPRARSIGADRRGGPVREALVEPHATGGSGQPLSHPTKDRARKPRKARDSAKTAVQHKAPQQQSVLGVTGGHPRSIEHAVSAPLAAKPPPPFQAAGIHIPGTSGITEPEDRKTIVVPASSSLISGKRESTRAHEVTSPNVEVSAEQSVSKVTPISLPIARPASVPNEKSPITPVRHGRIPSTGNRATVMDVALALSEHEAQARNSTTEVLHEPVIQTAPEPKVESPTTQEDDEMEEPLVIPDVKSMVANWGPRNGASSPVEKRKSSYEKYSAFILPPLTEEKTPINSPAGTLRNRGAVPSLQEEQPHELTSNNAISEVVSVHVQVTNHSEPGPDPVCEPPTESNVVIIEHADEPLPHIDVNHLLEVSDNVYKPDPDVNSISVEVMSIVGNSASVIDQEPNVFYESEALVIIHRFKTKSSGLVGTKVWSWVGTKATLGDREERKIQELARRYNTSRIAVSQYAEPAELVHHLGGSLAIRQGTRAHWSSENTAMHIVRMLHGSIYIDELDLSVKNLCSGFAYCVSLLGAVYVWYGKGSIQEERLAAIEYAQRIAVSPEGVVELSEGENDDDEMFWMILGDRDYAQADYWQWRQSSPVRSPRVWKVDQQRPFTYDVSSGLSWESLHEHVYVVDNVWEYFVLIGRNARGKRTETRLALQIAFALSRKTASEKPLYPAVHALVFPTQIPTDLRLSLRGMDELSLNHGELPDHMNLTSVERALELLKRTTWDKTLLQDPLFLPIGLDPTNAQSD